jgi:DNA-binding protein H-NS
MATTLAQLNRQIEKLQREANLLKGSQAKAVIARIRKDINEYQLTAADLGFEKASTPARKRRGPVKVSPKKIGSASKAGRRTNLNKASSAARYRDADGNEWVGRGRPPFWFVAALESGKTREELEVKG